MGALTNKVYAYKYRSWELLSYETIDLSNSLGTPIIIQMQENKPIRILPLIKKAEKNDFITNDTRFSLDVEFNNRLTKLQKCFYYKKDNTLTSIFLPINSSVYNIQRNENLQIITGNRIDKETLIFIKNFLNNLNIPLHSINDLNNADFRSSYLFLNFENKLKVCDSLILLGCDLSLEEPLLELKLRQYFLDYNIPIYALGNVRTQILKSISLGKTVFDFLNLNLGKNNICNKLLNLKNPLIIIGREFFSNINSNLLLTSIKKIFKSHLLFNTKFNLFKLNFSVINYIKSMNYNSYSNIIYNLHNSNTLFNNILNLEQNISNINAFELGVNLTKYFKYKKLSLMNNNYNYYSRILYLINVDTIKVKKNIYKNIIYQGSHSDLGVSQADIIIPSVTSEATEGLYLDIFGNNHYIKKIYQKLSNIKLQGYYLYKFFYSIFSSTTKKYLKEIYTDIYSQMQYKHFRYILLNKYNNIISMKNYFSLNLFKFHTKIEHFENIIRIQKSEFEKTTNIELYKYLYIPKINIKKKYINKYSLLFLNLYIKQKQNIWDSYLYIENNKDKNYSIISKRNIKNNLINYMLNDNIKRSSLYVTLGWLRFTETKNNFKL